MLGPAGVLALIDLWLRTSMNNPDGVLCGMDEEDIALEADWEGDPCQFVEALIKCGFLERTEDGTYRLHDWEQHQPWVAGAKERSERARKAARRRWDRKKESCAMHADRMHAACEAQCDQHTTCSAPFPSPLLSLNHLSSFPGPSTEEKEAILSEFEKRFSLQTQDWRKAVILLVFPPKNQIGPGYLAKMRDLSQAQVALLKWREKKNKADPEAMNKREIAKTYARMLAEGCVSLEDIPDEFRNLAKKIFRSEDNKCKVFS